jgi:hypothetical protein
MAEKIQKRFPDDPQIKGVLALIDRSPDTGDGWRSVSPRIWPHVQAVPDELVERRDDDGFWIRMTDAGRAVLKYA